VRVYLRILALVEGAGLFACFYIGIFLRFWGAMEVASLSVGELAPRALLFMTITLLAMLAVGLYRARQTSSTTEMLMRVATAVAISALAHFALYYVFPSTFTGRGALALAFILAAFFLALVRTGFRSLVGGDFFRRNVLVIGQGHVAASVQRFLGDAHQRDYRVVGYFAASGDTVDPRCAPILEGSGRLVEFSADGNVDEIIVAMDDRRNNFPARELLDCRLAGVKVTDPLSFIERETGRINLEVLRPGWLIYGHGFRQDQLFKTLKRTFDVTTSLILLIVALPALVFASAATLLEARGRGGVIYRQTRTGLHGKPFELYKLRTMIPQAEADGLARWATENDPRVTRVGEILRRLRIDELPQVINILKGEMSFVGPRPERPEFVDELCKQIPYYGERHCVKPGLTGWAQLSYPYGASVRDAREKLQFDLYYVKNQSVVFDLLILAQTLDVVIWSRKHTVATSGTEEGEVVERGAFVHYAVETAEHEPKVAGQTP